MYAYIKFSPTVHLRLIHSTHFDLWLALIIRRKRKNKERDDEEEESGSVCNL